MRASRHDFFDAHKGKQHQFTREELLQVWNNLSKRKLKDAGIIGCKMPSSWRTEINGRIITVVAHTKSEARAGFKQVVGKLPSGLKIERLSHEVSV